MLDTEEVDDDYFTPVASTSLANIFGDTIKSDETAKNESLKYTPPKQHGTAQKPEDSKATECIYASALVGHEWFNNVYTSKGKLGFAILKFIKTGFHNIVLYDANKTTLSCASVSPTLEVTVNGNHISYYDNFQKYWSLYGTETDIKKILETLTNIGITMKNTTEANKELPEPEQKENHTITLPHEEAMKKDITNSDTDSSMKRRTKMSILNRMASMGHSVLPPHTYTKDGTSDSSDANESNDHSKTIRHKPVKNVIKRIHPEKSIVISEPPNNLIETQHQAIVPKFEQGVDNNSLYSYINGVLVPVRSSNLIPGPSGMSHTDMDFFMSEQRVNNSEVRININRITDKVDHIIDKMSHLERKDDSSHTSTDLQNEIMHKLIREYENKIKVYEDLLKLGVPDTKRIDDDHAGRDNRKEIQNLNSKLSELDQVIIHKNHEISQLTDQIQNLQAKLDEDTINRIKDEKEYKKEIMTLKEALTHKNEESLNVTNEEKNLLVNMNELEFGDRVKKIMNDAYQTLADNFDNSNNYSGETIKKIIAVVIKKVTMESIASKKLTTY